MTNEILLRLGCRPSMKGFLPLQYCINYALEHNKIPITKLYYECAEIYGGNWRQIERNIRQCIHSAYKIKDYTIWNKLFYYDVEAPSPKDFIAFVVCYIKSEEEDKNALESNNNR